jgi:hypothetical protein
MKESHRGNGVVPPGQEGLRRPSRGLNAAPATRKAKRSRARVRSPTVSPLSTVEQ